MRPGKREKKQAGKRRKKPAGKGEKKPWVVKYFRTRHGNVPALKFRESLPEALAAKLLRITAEVAQSGGALGGGYYEICHSHPALSETRAKLGKDLARFICGRDGDRLILLTGVAKGPEDPTPESTFIEAELLLAEYFQTRDTV